ncbi:hypothetical protein GS876_10310 [Rhodococcus hoagii]|nr:hypothetical protein [Prescottella equi]NKT31576.1 hypothetical protein [Prescottella equi]NKT35956.1 hypothetical protein [Prescottella equi]NKT39271.1 hypothetical protein [Prescottella equi]NKT75899.1 hypothetical protein [Prescottella equi]
MRFFLDENMHQGMVEHLSSVFDPHEFCGVNDLGTKGADDVVLFEKVSSAGCQVFVTGDLKQLRRPHERAACKAAGLHWIGVHQVHAQGFHVVAGPVSTLVHALPFALGRLETAPEPLYFQLKKSERVDSQVFHSNGLL